MNRTIYRAVALFLSLSAGSAFATDGYFAHGFGIKAQGMGGVGIALPQDGLAAATNPAGTVLVGDRVDAGVSLFAPDRGATISGSGVPGANGDYDGNGTSTFLLPEAGYIRHLSDATAVGIAAYGNGGMNTDYHRNPYSAYGSTGSGGVNLEQLFISPSIAYKLNEQNAIGVAVNFAYQRFSAKGLGAFSGASADPSNLSNNGSDSSTGWGLRVGWTGQVTSALTLGATWSSKIHTGSFDQYKGLFADSGSFDIPENYGVGLAYKITPTVTVATDVQQINYSGVNAIANPLANLLAGNPLGSAKGPGFGWRDVTVVKIGASYDYSSDLTLRVGYNHSSQPIPANQTFFNILAPGVVQDHLTFGGTWKNGSNGELSVAYTHGFNKTVRGANSIPAAFGGGNADINLSENILGISYAWKL